MKKLKKNHKPTFINFMPFMVNKKHFEKKQMIWIKSLYKNRNIYLLLMIALLLVMAVLDSFELTPLLITVLLVVFYFFLIMRYYFLNYPIIFLIIVALLCLTSVFQVEFIQWLTQYSDNKLVEHYLLNGGSNITMIVILLLFIYSFLAQQKTLKKNREEDLSSINDTE